LKKIIVGLGNPGREYENTRHNTGFMLADLLCPKFRKSRTCPLLISKAGDFIAVKPATYMNRSGIALKCVLDKLGADKSDLLVACDDFNLPLGKLRLRPSGSSGGHNGLQSVIDSLGTNEFPRLRLGIGGADVIDKTGYVLEKFSKKELESVRDMLSDAKEVVYYYLENGMEAAMNKFN
jgi:PTH1 family peptidyl-tRNA hydrolase